jgi:hypothetical protein
VRDEGGRISNLRISDFKVEGIRAGGNGGWRSYFLTGLTGFTGWMSVRRVRLRLDDDVGLTALVVWEGERAKYWADF